MLSDKDIASEIVVTFIGNAGKYSIRGLRICPRFFAKLVVERPGI